MWTESCHAGAAHRRLRGSDVAVSSLMLDRSLDAILRRIRLDRNHDIPYVAGYSQDGRVIYIDRQMPTIMNLSGREVHIDRYLILHEAVEKSLIDNLGLHYQHAHQIALRVEEAAIRADGISWHDYDQAMQCFVRKFGDKVLTSIPSDLDVQPYRDEHDWDLLKRMAKALPGQEHMGTTDICVGV